MTERAAIQPQPPADDPPRYTDAPLPPYRFVPGGPWPHPVRDPAGHMHNTPDPDEPILPPERWADQRTYLLGVDLFNHAYWWEAHEAWEHLWKHGTTSEQRDFAHGLIHLAAALLKWHLRKERGVRILLERCHGRLDPVAATHDRYMGLDVGGLLGRIDTAALEPLPATPAAPIIITLTA